MSQQRAISFDGPVPPQPEVANWQASEVRGTFVHYALQNVRRLEIHFPTADGRTVVQAAFARKAGAQIDCDITDAGFRIADDADVILYDADSGAPIVRTREMAGHFRAFGDTITLTLHID